MCNGCKRRIAELKKKREKREYEEKEWRKNYKDEERKGRDEENPQNRPWMA